jgi:hypothetical protein
MSVPGRHSVSECECVVPEGLLTLRIEEIWPEGIAGLAGCCGQVDSQRVDIRSIAIPEISVDDCGFHWAARAYRRVYCDGGVESQCGSRVEAE